MLQRSPAFVFSLSGKDRLVPLLRKWLPVKWAMALNWWRHMLLETLFVFSVLRFPSLGRKLVMSATRRQLPPDFDIDTHFNPRYNVFEQRLCFCPDGDFFRALHRPERCAVVTDTIETVTEIGILTSSGRTIPADMIITATGLYMTVFGDTPLVVDGEPVSASIGQRYCWNGSMLEGIPNSGTVVGYTAGTWTPGADARVRVLIKVIKHMDSIGATSAVPFINPEERRKLPRKSALKNSSTYIVRARERLPLVADVGPWRNATTWVADVWYLIFGSVTNGISYTVPERKKQL
jgi:cation diffusion facilitator CzcD-associated flavoprotein CzcO